MLAVDNNGNDNGAPPSAPALVSAVEEAVDNNDLPLAAAVIATPISASNIQLELLPAAAAAAATATTNSGLSPFIVTAIATKGTKEQRCGIGLRNCIGGRVVISSIATDGLFASYKSLLLGMEVVSINNIPITTSTTVAISIIEDIVGQVVLQAKPASVIQLASGNGTLERSFNPDGSLAVKVITTTARHYQSKEITTEYFHIPSNIASKVMKTLDAGSPPRSVYRTNMNTRIEEAGSSSDITPPINAQATPPTPTPPAIPPTTRSPPTTNNTAINDLGYPQSRQPSTPQELEAAIKKKGFVMFFVLIAVAIIVGLIVFAVERSKSGGGQSTPSTTTTKYFDKHDGGKDGVLYNAVRSYVSQDCANNQECSIGQTYGWPMNSWCVGNVTDMSELFHNMNTFNEDISDWNTSSVTSMNRM